ncbi:MAG: ABC transporter substrate-binding protein [Caldilineaceae bacterium]
MSSFSSRSSSLSPAESIGKHLRWQIILALLGAALLATLLGFSAYQTTTVLVPERGGVFREGIVGSPQYLNPLWCDSVVSDLDRDWCELIYRGLTKIDKSGRIQPEIAESWKIEADRVYTFKLKTDQYWDDGEQVTADDVLYTVRLAQNPNASVPPELSVIWQTVTPEKLGDFEVRFTLNQPLAPFMDYTSIGLLPAHIFANKPINEVTSALNMIPVGNGRFKVDQMTSDHFQLSPNPFYTGKLPYLTGLELWFYPEYFSLFTAFNDGKLDGMSRIREQDLPTLGQRSNVQLFSSERSEYLCVILNLRSDNVPFFKDKKVRQALLMGIDREKLIEQIANGQGIIANSPILPESWAYDPDVPQYPYSPSQAIQMLEQDGWVDSNGDGIREKDGKPLQFQLLTNDSSQLRIDLIKRIAEDWKQLGVLAVVTPVEFSGLVNDFLVPRRFDAVLLEWEITGDPDPLDLWHSSQAEGSGSNYGGWSNPQADELMEQARTTTDEAKRIKLYHQFQEIFADETPALLLYYPVYTYAVSSRIHNVQIDSLNRPAERFETFADWYINTRRIPANQAPANAPPTPPGS